MNAKRTNDHISSKAYDLSNLANNTPTSSPHYYKRHRAAAEAHEHAYYVTGEVDHDKHMKQHDNTCVNCRNANKFSAADDQQNLPMGWIFGDKKRIQQKVHHQIGNFHGTECGEDPRKQFNIENSSTHAKNVSSQAHDWQSHLAAHEAHKAAAKHYVDDSSGLGKWHEKMAKFHYGKSYRLMKKPKNPFNKGIMPSPPHVNEPFAAHQFANIRESKFERASSDASAASYNANKKNTVDAHRAAAKAHYNAAMLYQDKGNHGIEHECAADHHSEMVEHHYDQAKKLGLGRKAFAAFQKPASTLKPDVNVSKPLTSEETTKKAQFATPSNVITLADLNARDAERRKRIAEKRKKLDSKNAHNPVYWETRKPSRDFASTKPLDDRSPALILHRAAKAATERAWRASEEDHNPMTNKPIRGKAFMQAHKAAWHAHSRARDHMYVELTKKFPKIHSLNSTDHPLARAVAYHSRMMDRHAKALGLKRGE